MILVILIMIFKTFFYLRIFSELSFLVAMLRQVTYDLKDFLMFYTLLCVMFGGLLGIIDLGNYEFSPD